VKREAGAFLASCIIAGELTDDHLPSRDAP